MRSVVLDTETTGMPVTDGHRIIEIGCVELEGRRLTGRHFHVYLQPDREVDEGAIAVHGITNEYLKDKPRFREVANDFFEFIRGAQLIIHNAAFDIGFINNEFALLGQQDRSDVTEYCSVLDTLLMARERHPGQRNNLDALCKRYGVDNSGRDLHGALLDAEILADVYLLMTGGQSSLVLESAVDTDALNEDGAAARERQLHEDLPVVTATVAEIEAHGKWLARLAEKGENGCVWNNLQLDQQQGDSAAVR